MVSKLKIWCSVIIVLISTLLMFSVFAFAHETDEPHEELDDTTTTTLLEDTTRTTLLEETTTTAIETTTTTIPEPSEDPGVTPDSFLWGLDRAIERISLLLTFDKSAKAKKGLAHARERLLEVKAMIEQKKLDAAEKAKEEHGRALGRVKDKIKEIKDEDPEDEIEDELDVEDGVEEHESEIEELETEIEAKIKGNLTAEQKALVDQLIESFKGEVGKLKIEIKNEQEKTKIKIKVVQTKNPGIISRILNLIFSFIPR